MQNRKQRVLAAAGIAAGAAILLGLFLMLGPPKLLAKSGQPEFCVRCHVMEGQYEAWMHAGAHRRKNCVDCHLPNENGAVHYTWKAVDGLKDMAVFYTGAVPERIALTDHGKAVVQQNCVRCHEQTVMMIDQGRRCWSCHRRISHTRSGSIETL